MSEQFVIIQGLTYQLMGVIEVIGRFPLPQIGISLLKNASDTCSILGVRFVIVTIPALNTKGSPISRYVSCLARQYSSPSFRVVDCGARMAIRSITHLVPARALEFLSSEANYRHAPHWFGKQAARVKYHIQSAL